MDTPDPVSRDDLTRLESRLADWAPSTPALNRDRVLFEAGRASVRPGRSRTCAAGLAVLAIAFGAWAVHERSQRRSLEVALRERTHALQLVQSRQVVAPEPSTPLPDRAPAPDSYLSLSHRLATLGLDDVRDASPPSDEARPLQRPAGVLTPLSIRRDGGLADL
jgi:hypothetical protein